MKPHRPSFRVARAALGALALAVLSGCGSYVSEYVPPPDGRARPVYRDGAVAMELGGAIPECLSGEQGSGAALPPRASRAAAAPPVRVTGGFWVPIYVGPRIVVERHGVAPPPPHLHRPGPDVVRTPASPSKGGTSGPGSKAASGGSGGGSGDSTAGNAAASILLATVAVLALAALPPIAVGLSVGSPERDKDSALALDQVNAYNDLARTPGSPCALPAPEGQLP
ncbi:hypothetical protein WME76_33275 [Sorangium sp. So ce119]|uniref:hypothetical protein n=1 Tax=Sorangium sp. So ce119 TaxID=3133279 RepID=UPI003F604AC6